MEAKRRKIENSGDIAKDEVKPGQRAVKCVSEEDVGITEFVNSSLKGFSGLIKQRYSDFQVNEITAEGEVLRLKHIPMPEKTEKPAEVAPAEISPNEHTEKLAEITSKEFVEQCFALLNGSEETRARTKMIDRSLRGEIHGLIREGFDSRLDSKTDEGRITAVKFSKHNRRKNGMRGPKRTGENLHFTLYKENKETMEAVSMISKVIHTPPKSITFAGTKDRRAVTTQRACWRRGDWAQLAGFNGVLKAGNVQVGDFSFENFAIKLGDLSGNQFGIVIREVDQDAHAEIDEALTSLRENGFVNYFGLQRFGTYSTSSHTTGMLILREDYEAAVEGLLEPQDLTFADSREAREIWQNTKDATKALELMPRRCIAETALLNGLKESSNALNALQRVPYNLRTMYVHAYQSYVWNRAASERICWSRTHALVGDLVWGSTNDRGLQDVHKISTEEEALKYTIFDVILPLPGNDVIYPDNMVAFYEDLMAQDGIDCHQMQRKVREFSVFGTYRALMAKPKFLDWCFRKYAESDTTVLYTDKEAIEFGEKLAPECGNKTALVVTMGLSVSQYATMALREAMKKETSRNGDIYFG